ncbi:MAG: hypothetical protein U9R25_12380 [Chloroflexota bacterium]|nr:hypothetical protein [Chloroflexota bacterium]
MRCRRGISSIFRGADQPRRIQPGPNWLAIANIFYPTQDTALSLTISVIDTTSARLPADLAGKPFDDPEVIQRFNGLLDFVATQTPDLTLATLSIGNEVDGYLNGKQWAQYQEFFRATSAHARQLWPDVPVGAKAMFDGLTGDAQEPLMALNQHSDAIFVTYYPLDRDFTVKEPDIVLADFDAISQLYPDRSIYFLELGYPSGEDNDSSQAMQAEFVRQTFQAWDAHQDQVKLISFTWLTDIDPAAVKGYERYHGISGKGFASYLGTLGLRTYNGEDKDAFRALNDETKRRGWTNEP